MITVVISDVHMRDPVVGVYLQRLPTVATLRTHPAPSERCGDLNAASDSASRCSPPSASPKFDSIPGLTHRVDTVAVVAVLGWKGDIK